MSSEIQLLQEPGFGVRVFGGYESIDQVGNLPEAEVYCLISYLTEWIVPGHGKWTTRNDCLIRLRSLTPRSIASMLAHCSVPPNIIYQNLERLAKFIFFEAKLTPCPPQGSAVLRMGVHLLLHVDKVPFAVAVSVAADLALFEEEPKIGFVPAADKAIKGLERVRVSEEASKDVNECSVCLEEIRLGSEVIRLPCSHSYHADCIVKWLSTSKFCPLCRFEMPSSSQCHTQAP